MKKLTAHLSERFFITASVLIAFFAITTFVVAEVMSTEASAEATIANMDYTGDGEVDVSDVVYLCRFLAEDRELKIVNIVDPNDDGFIDILDVHYILLYIVKIDPENPTPGHEYPTTSATTNTTTAETTTNTTTTVVTQPLVADNEIYSKMIDDNMVVEKQSYFVYSGNLYESKGSYIFEHGGKNWFFSFLTEEELTDYQILKCPDRIVGYHLWPAFQADVASYKEWFEQENLPNLDAKLPYSAESLCHDIFGNFYEYKLRPWRDLTVKDIDTVLTDMLIEDDLPPVEHLQKLDYTLDSYLTDKDLAIITSYYCLNYLYENDLSEFPYEDSIDYIYDVNTKTFTPLA